MKKEMIIMFALALVREFFLKEMDKEDINYGPGIDLTLALSDYAQDSSTIDSLLEFGALVTHCIDNTDQPIETFYFTDRRIKK
jgi:hypothetical protein